MKRFIQSSKMNKMKVLLLKLKRRGQCAELLLGYPPVFHLFVICVLICSLSNPDKQLPWYPLTYPQYGPHTLGFEKQFDEYKYFSFSHVKIFIATRLWRKCSCLACRVKHKFMALALDLYWMVWVSKDWVRKFQILTLRWKCQAKWIIG